MIASYIDVPQDQIKKHSPTLVYLDADNKIIKKTASIAMQLVWGRVDMKIIGNKNCLLKLAQFEIDGQVVKEDDSYIVQDNATLKNLILSSTNLNPKKETSGHNHSGQEEIYFFVSGKGEMQLDDEEFTVNSGDIVLVKENVFHKVSNTSDKEKLYFICVLHGARHN